MWSLYYWSNERTWGSWKNGIKTHDGLNLHLEHSGLTRTGSVGYLLDRHFWSNSYIGIIRRMVESPTMSERLPESNVPIHDQTCLPLAHGTVPEFPPCFIL